MSSGDNLTTLSIVGDDCQVVSSGHEDEQVLGLSLQYMKLVKTVIKKMGGSSELVERQHTYFGPH